MGTIEKVLYGVVFSCMAVVAGTISYSVVTYTQEYQEYAAVMEYHLDRMEDAALLDRLPVPADAGLADFRTVR